MLTLRRGVVLAVGDLSGPRQDVEVRLGGERRRAVGELALVGEARLGDEVIVALAAPGEGPDSVHANLTRGLRGVEPAVPATAVKLAGTSLRHGVRPIELDHPRTAAWRAPGAPVAVCLRHGDLAPLAWAFGRALPGARLGLVQTPGGALAAGASPLVARLRERGLLAGHLTAGAAFGGDAEALTLAGALRDGFGERHWHAAVCAPGFSGAPRSVLTAPPVPLGEAALRVPAELREADLLGVGVGAFAEPAALEPAEAAALDAAGGLAALDAVHAAAALDCQVMVVAALPEDAGTAAVLDLSLVPVVVAFPRAGARGRERWRGGRAGRHEWRRGDADLDTYAGSGLPAPRLVEDPAPYANALAAGSVLAALTRAV